MRHPEWIKVPLSGTHETRRVLRQHGVSTVCEESRCPNQGHCFSRRTATFMILGDRCTRNCSFCAVESAQPLPPDPDEPRRVAEAAKALGLSFAVVTSVTRDDLPDGGAGQFAETIRELRNKIKLIKIEVLTPDFKGKSEVVRTVIDAGPDVFNHNVETVPRLYRRVRPLADYQRSLDVLAKARSLAPGMRIKSGMMLGLGETEAEVLSVMDDLLRAGCDSLTIGQYLQPRKTNIPVFEYISPAVFEEYGRKGRAMGFRSVASSPLSRSSMNAGEMFSGNHG